MTAPTPNLERNEARMPSAILDRHMEAARAVYEAWEAGPETMQWHVARALADAEKHGMRRAAEIAKRKGDTVVGISEFNRGYREGRYSAAIAILEAVERA